MRLYTISALAQAAGLIAPAWAAAVPPVVELTYENTPDWDLSDPHEALVARQTQDTACRNGPLSRACWQAGYSIATDFDNKVPPAGRTVTYDLEITNTTHMAPDGFQRLVMAVNGQYPGPTLYADWGDTLVINVKNSLQHNGTSIHWHGLRQLNSCQHDGVNGVTECPIAPGQTKQYVIRCTQFGTSWYHSHYSAQYGDGIVGGIIINGPASANYDTDLGTLTLTDWYHETAFALNHRALHSTTGPPRADTGLINGTMKSSDGQSGAYHTTTVTPNKKFRLRIINTAVNNLFHFSIDSHNFTVITSDFVPIRPYTASSIAIGIGQRYDIIINANQPISNYWLRADPGACGGNAMAGRILGIINYDGAPLSDPTTTNLIPKPTACYDESVTPYVNNQVPREQFDSAMDTFIMDFNLSRTAEGGALVQWLINGSDIRVDWERPTLQNVLEKNFTFEAKRNVFEITQRNTWSFWVIQTIPDDTLNIPHPIHLHGHDFYILGSGNGVWDGDKDNLKFSNPSRRDTATLPAGGYLILGFPADNPGLWLMHCHIAWHVGQGLSMQFLERKDEIVDAIGALGDYQKTCDSWRTWWNSNQRIYDMDDSGL